MSDQNADQAVAVVVVALCGLILFMLLTGFVFTASQSNNQIVRPNPFAPSAPVVDGLPRLLSELRSMKAQCEGRTSAAIESIRVHQYGQVHLDTGRRLYDEAKADTDKCITYLKTAMFLRFNNDDPEHIATMLMASRARVDAVVEWARRHEPPTFGDAIPAQLLELVTAFIGNTQKQNEHAIEMLAGEMDECRIKNWTELDQSTSQPTAFYPAPSQ